MLGLTVVAAATATAQPASTPAAARAFVTRRGADTVLVERIERGADATIVSHLTFRSAGPLAGMRVDASFTPTADGRVSRAVLETTPPRTAPQHITLTFGAAPADSIELQLNGGAAQRQPGARGALPYLNLCVADLELIVHRARVIAAGGATRPTSVPLFIGVSLPPAAATVTRVGADSAILTLGGVDLRLRVSADDHVLGVVVPAQGITIDAADPRAVAALRAPAPPPPPSYAPPAGAPYAAEEVRVPTPGGFTLAGTLTRPTDARGPVPVVVTITGSGPQERDERLDGMPGYAIFRQIADTLGRRGIGVLRFDDRGVGASGGTFATATSRDFADDVRAVLAWLRARAAAQGDVDAARLALLGHSEGGLIAPMVAADDRALAAVVLLAGPAYDGRRILTHQFRIGIVADPTLAPPRRDSLLAAADHLRDSVLASNAWMRYFRTYDPLTAARRVRAPVLVVQGATDRQVTPEQADTLAAALRAGGNADVTERVFPATNHLFLADVSGAPAGYAALPSRAVRPEVLGVVADWLAARLARGATR